MSKHERLVSLRWENGALYIVDQTLLPFELREEKQESVEQLRRSIQALKVRGAPALGIAAAYGLVLAMQPYRDESRDGFIEKAEQAAAYINSARPTAVNISWALKRLCGRIHAMPHTSGAALYEALENEASAIHAEDKAICEAIGRRGAELIRPGCGIITHCNAGALATGGSGTALSPLYAAHAKGVPFRVYADETRPLLQGARLTAFELSGAGIDVTLVCDSMAADLMSRGRVDMCIVGCDRVAANGDTANKIGTLGLAVLAKHFGIDFYVACPSSTFDAETPSGDAIVIEERDGSEVRGFASCSSAPADVPVYNPAFDVTPHALISGFVTEQGLIREPYYKTFEALRASSRC